MKNIIFMSLMLTFLASCTLIPEKPTTPVTDKPESKMDSTMMDDNMMQKDTMMSGSMEKPMMDDNMMTGGDMMKKEDDAMDTSMMMDDKKMMNDTMMKKDDRVMMKPSGYIEYDAKIVDEALASGQKVALFFHATWCPSCKALNNTLKNEVSTIPSDTLIVQVDYDTSTELKKKYRVVGQHTTVVLNSDGSDKSKKIGARSISEIFN